MNIQIESTGETRQRLAVDFKYFMFMYMTFMTRLSGHVQKIEHRCSYPGSFVSKECGISNLAPFSMTDRSSRNL